MTFAYRSLFAALMMAGLASGAAHGQGVPELKFSGFGTLAAVHSDDRNADFTNSIFPPNGAGHTRATSFNPDSKLGGQVDAVFDPRWSAVLQLVAQHRYDNSFTPQVEWANVKFQATPELSLRAGRTALPSFLFSDTRHVGYAQPWVRPPVEVYYVLPITSNDGVDAIYRKQFGSVSNALQAYYGSASARMPGNGKIKSSPSWGLNDTVQVGDLTLRASYNANHVDLDLPSANRLMDGYAELSAAPDPIGPQAAALAQKYNPHDMKLGAFSIAAQYDPGRWFVMSELVDLRGDGILADSRSWYATAGYRFGNFTPYVSYASTRSKVASEPGIPLPDAEPLNAGLNSLLANEFNGSQDTASVGVRWDFMKNAALKLQYDHVDLAAGSSGRFTNVQPTFERGGDVNLFSVALDFVF